MHFSFSAHPSSYRHWKLEVQDDKAFLSMKVDENAGCVPGYQLKLNSYDLGVDIELSDAIERIRFEYPSVRAVVIRSENERVFCAGANIFMLGQSSHAFKVNFCKYTNETRLGMEEASEQSGIHFLCAVKGTCAGGGYELALACDEIILVDDGSSAVSLPEVPLLGVLPGTGGLTRLVDKRKVRRDWADAFCTLAEGFRGKRALEMGLVDALASKSEWEEQVNTHATRLAQKSTRKPMRSVQFSPLSSYQYVELHIEEDKRLAHITLSAPSALEPDTLEGMYKKGESLWYLLAFRELNDVLLQLRFHHREVGTWVFRTKGNTDYLLMAEKALLLAAKEDGFAHEVLSYAKRVLQRIDVSSRSLVTLVEPNSAYAGILAELLWVADRSFLLESDEGTAVHLSEVNFGMLPMHNGLSRLSSRYFGQPETLKDLQSRMAQSLDVEEIRSLGMVTSVLDEIDYEDEVRLFLEERASLSPDALSGLEASLRFAGPETLATKIFARLSAWQNWVFNRSNSTGERGALTCYGKSERPLFNFERC